jgi:hypothetical protein
MPDDPTRRKMRPFEAPPPAPAYGAVTFGHVAMEGALCIECCACARRTVLTKSDCPAIRPGNPRYVLHATFRCRCGATDVRLYQATIEESVMFIAGDPLRRQIGRHRLGA